MTIRAPWRELALVGFGAALLSLYARLEAPFVAFGFVALVPQLAALDRARSWRGALALALAMSAAWTVALFGWFPRVLAGYTQAPLWACWVAVVLGAPLWQPQLIAFALGRYVLRRRHESRWLRAALPLAFVYVGAEWLVPKLFGDTLGHGLYPWRLVRQAADVAGAHGLTLVVLLANEALLATARRFGIATTGYIATVSRHTPSGTHRLAWSSARPVVAAVGLLAVLAAYGAWRDRRLAAVEPTEVLAVGLVQANITHYDKLAAEAGRFEVVRAILDAHFTLSDELLEDSPLDVLVWPETVYPTTFGAPRTPEGAAFDRALGGFVAARRVPLIFGAYDVEDGREFNAAVFLSPAAGEGRVEFDTYRKAKLFPLTEWVPPSLDTRALRRWLPWMGTWTPGPGPTALQLPLEGAPRATIAPLICYEAAFAGHALAAARGGAELIVTLSNDSWFVGSPAPRLHLALAAFRSIETRLWQVRATNSGISAVIAPNGDIVAATSIDERAVLSYRVPRAQSRTPFVVFGDWLGPSGIAIGLAALGSVLFRRPS